MCQATDAVRHLLGIRDYHPGPHPPAKIRKPTWHGVRGNGHAPGLAVSDDPVVADLAREHRIIRQMMADDERRRTRGSV